VPRWNANVRIGPPEAARVREGLAPARGHRIPLPSVGVNRFDVLYLERDGGGYRHRRGKVKGVEICAGESVCFAWRFFLEARSTRMILWRRRIRHSRT
jgi:hypothetical protein